MKPGIVKVTSRAKRDLVCLLCIAMILVLSACAEVGPRSVSAGRGVYTDVINQTEDEQLLNMILRIRYDETFGMMSVASVTASLRFRAQAVAEVGIGSSDDYEGNLVPFSTGVAYEENPTVTYIPLSGEDFSRRMLAPVTLEEWGLLGGFARSKGEVFAFTAQRVNHMKNPIIGEEDPSEDFSRFIDIYGRLRENGVLHVVNMGAGASDIRYAWRIRDDSDFYGDQVRDFLDLLGIDQEFNGSPINLPISELEDSLDTDIVLETRSPLQMLRAFGYGIQVPAEHLEAGIAEPVKINRSADQFINIQSSDTPPDNATVRTQFRGHWFYVDAADTRTKRGFMLLRVLVGIRMSHSSSEEKRPVLTLPVN